MIRPSRDQLVCDLVKSTVFSENMPHPSHISRHGSCGVSVSSMILNAAGGLQFALSRPLAAAVSEAVLCNLRPVNLPVWMTKQLGRDVQVKTVAYNADANFVEDE